MKRNRITAAIMLLVGLTCVFALAACGSNDRTGDRISMAQIERRLEELQDYGIIETVLEEPGEDIIQEYNEELERWGEKLLPQSGCYKAYFVDFYNDGDEEYYWIFEFSNASVARDGLLMTAYFSAYEMDIRYDELFLRRIGNIVLCGRERYMEMILDIE